MLLTVLLAGALVTSPSISDAERVGETLLQLEEMAGRDNGHVAVAAHRDTVVQTSPPAVSAFFRRQRIDDAIRRVDLKAAERDVVALGGPDTLRCVGPRENTGGQALAEPSDADDVVAFLAREDKPTEPPPTFLVRRGPRGLFDIDDHLIASRDVRVRCFVAVRSTQAQSATLHVGSSGGVAAWLGAARAVAVLDRGDHPFVADMFAVPLKVTRGTTLLAIELSIVDFGGVLSVRLTTPKGAPAPGVRFSSSVADLKEAAGAAAAMATTAPAVQTWQPSTEAAVGLKSARLMATFLGRVRAFDHRQRPSPRRQAVDAWVDAARAAGDDDELAAALIARAEERDDDDDITGAMAALDDARALGRLSSRRRGVVFSALANVRERQDDQVGAARFWSLALEASPDDLSLFTKRAAFERRRRVLGAPHERAIIVAAEQHRYQPLWRLAADVATDRGDVAASLAFLSKAEDHSVRLSREQARDEALLAVDSAARGRLRAALETRLRILPSSHFAAERLANLLVDDGHDADADAVVAARQTQYATRPEPFRLAAQLAERRGARDHALVALRTALSRTPDNGELQRLIRDLSRDEGDDLAARLLPPFDDEVAAAARVAPPADAAVTGAFVHRKVIATRYFDNGNLERVEDIVVVITDAQRVPELARWSWAYAGDREAMTVLVAERLSADGRREAPQSSADRGNDNKENGAYSDGRVASVAFAGVNDGDVFHLRIRKETVGLQNLFGDFFGDIEVLDGALPARSLTLIYEGPTERPLYHGGRGAPDPVVVQDGAVTRTTFGLTDIPAIVPEPGMPPYFEVARYLSVSTYADWGQLGAWYERLVGDQLALDDTLRGVVKTLKARSRDRRDLVRLIYELVVTETRYVGIELGIHGWKPYAVTEVYRRRFGDCKDKASLLVALLREAGVDAHLTLVRTTHLGHAAQAPASMWAFNHAIAWVSEFDLFLDGTAERHGDNELPTMDQGALALIVDGAASRLVTIPVAPATANDNTSAYVLQLQRDGAILAEGDERYQGARAPPERRRFEDAAQRSRVLEVELAQMIPGAQLQVLDVSPLDLSQTTVGYRFRALLPKRASVDSDGTLTMPVSLYPHDLAGNYASSSARRFDIVLDHPWRTRNVMRYVVPAGMKVVDLPSGGSVDTPYVRFTQTITKTADGFIVDEDTAILKRQIPVNDYADFRAATIAADRLMKRKIRIVTGDAP